MNKTEIKQFLRDNKELVLDKAAQLALQDEVRVLHLSQKEAHVLLRPYVARAVLDLTGC